MPVPAADAAATPARAADTDATPVPAVVESAGDQVPTIFAVPTVQPTQQPADTAAPAVTATVAIDSDPVPLLGEAQVPTIFAAPAAQAILVADVGFGASAQSAGKCACMRVCVRVRARVVMCTKVRLRFRGSPFIVCECIIVYGVLS